MRAPTFEELSCATRICALGGWNGQEYQWSKYNDNADKHDQETAYLMINCSDMYLWACADAEPIQWDHIKIYEKGILERDKIFLELRGKIDTPTLCQLEILVYLCFDMAYISHVRGCEPENWLKHFKREDGKYRGMNEEEQKHWEEAKAWWANALEAQK